MPSVRLLVDLVGRDFYVPAGELYPCHAETAARFVADGIAEYDGEPEAAMVAVPEHAMRPRARKR